MRSHLQVFWKSLSPFPATSILLALFIVFSPLAANRHFLPIGWEIPKVFLVQVSSLLLVAAFSIEVFRSRTPMIPSSRSLRPLLLVLAALVIISFISTLLSDYTRGPLIASYINPLYQLLGSAGIEISRISVFGNPTLEYLTIDM